MMKDWKRKSETISFYIICFFTYSFVGWVYEVITMYQLGWGFVNRGFLYGCYLPIYGFSGLFFILILGSLVRKKVKIGKISITPILVFLFVVLISSVIEYVASYLIETYLGLVLWNYSDYKYNLNGRIALQFSIIFGVIGLIVFYVIQPLLTFARKHMKPMATIVIGLLIAVTMIIDLIFTICCKLN